MAALQVHYTSQAAPCNEACIYCLCSAQALYTLSVLLLCASAQAGRLHPAAPGHSARALLQDTNENINNGSCTLHLDGSTVNSNICFTAPGFSDKGHCIQATSAEAAVAAGKALGKLDKQTYKEIDCPSTTGSCPLVDTTYHAWKVNKICTSDWLGRSCNASNPIEAALSQVCRWVLHTHIYYKINELAEAIAALKLNDSAEGDNYCLVNDGELNICCTSPANNNDGEFVELTQADADTYRQAVPIFRPKNKLQCTDYVEFINALIDNFNSASLFFTNAANSVGGCSYVSGVVGKTNPCT